MENEAISIKNQNSSLKFGKYFQPTDIIVVLHSSIQQCSYPPGWHCMDDLPIREAKRFTSLTETLKSVGAEQHQGQHLWVAVKEIVFR